MEDDDTATRRRMMRVEGRGAIGALPGEGEKGEREEGELVFYSSIHHPNIIQLSCLKQSQLLSALPARKQTPNIRLLLLLLHLPEHSLPNVQD